MEKFTDDIYKCFGCGLCREFVFGEGEKLDHPYGVELICPVREHTSGFEGYYARGKIRMAKGILEGRIHFTEALAERLFSCTTCGNCGENCPPGVDVVKIIEAFRAEAKEKGFALKPHVEMARRVDEDRNPYGEKASKRLDWIPKGFTVKGKGENVYFVGCTSAYRRPEIPRAVINILNKANVPFAVLGDEQCCGSPLLRVGWRKLAEKIARYNVKNLLEAGAERVIFSCAGCYRSFTLDYPEILGEELEFETLHVTEFVDELINKNALKLTKPLEMEVTYHDPCHLGRHVKVYDPPREVIANIPKVNLTELYPTRGNSICCGAGGGMKMAYNKLAIEIAAQRIKKATEIGANSLASSCPFCKHNFLNAVKEYELNLAVYDVVELVERAISP